MLNQVFATKLKMSQGWTTTGRRVAITRCRVYNNIVIAKHTLTAQTDNSDNKIFELGYGQKKLKNISKPLRTKIEKSGFSVGVLGMKGVANKGDDVKVGDQIRVEQVLSVGDVVDVQGKSKGKGFAGAMKRHNFHGGSRTHGQSDRERAVGSVGAGTTPGRVWKGKKMPGQMGNVRVTTLNLIVLFVDNVRQEVWLSGPVPGSINSIIRISKVGKTKKIELDKKASGIYKEVVTEEKQSLGNEKKDSKNEIN